MDKKNQIDVTFVFFISLLLVAKHVSGNYVPIIRRCYSLVFVCAVAAGRLSRPVGR